MILENLQDNPQMIVMFVLISRIDEDFINGKIKNISKYC